MGEPLRGYSMPFDKQYNKFVRLSQIYSNYLEVQKSNLKTYRPGKLTRPEPIPVIEKPKPVAIIEKEKPIIEKPKPQYVPEEIKYNKVASVEWLFEHLKNQVKEAVKFNAPYLFVQLDIRQGWTIADVDRLSQLGFRITDCEKRYMNLEFRIKVASVQFYN